jgi:TRAP-type uncharacterized transport system fused permease subunit
MAYLTRIKQQITEYRLSAFERLDVVITTIVVIAVIREEKDRISHWWLPVVATLIVGPSCGLSLFMYLRE